MALSNHVTAHYIQTKEYGKLSFKVRREFTEGTTDFLACRPEENCLPARNKYIHYISNKGLSVCIEPSGEQRWVTVIHNKTWKRIMDIMLITAQQDTVFKAIDKLVNSYNWKVDEETIQSDNEQHGEKIREILNTFRTAIGAEKREL